MNLTTIKNLIKIKNASLVSKKKVVIKYHSFIVLLLKYMYKLGLIQNYNILKNKNIIIIFLRHYYDKIITTNIKLISTPSHKTFLNYKNVLSIKKQTNMTLFFSTSNGILTIQDCKKQNIGGVLLFIC